MTKLEKALNKAREGAAGVVEKIAAEINEDEGWSTDNLKDLERAVSVLVKLNDSCDKLGNASGDDPLKDFMKIRDEAKKKKAAATKKKSAKPKAKKAAATKKQKPKAAKKIKKPAKKKVRK